VSVFAVIPQPNFSTYVSFGDHRSRVFTEIDSMQDPLSAVLNATLTLLSGNESVSLRFDGEPPSMTWSFDLLPEIDEYGDRELRISIVVDSYWSFDGADHQIEGTSFTARVSLVDFATAVLNGSDCVAWEFGESGYSDICTRPRSKTSIEFPRKLVEDLRSRLASVGVQSDVEWATSEGWLISTNQQSSIVTMSLHNEVTNRIVIVRSLDLVGAMNAARDHIELGVPDC